MTVKQLGYQVLFCVAGALVTITTHAFQPTPAFEDREIGFQAHTEYFSTEANLTPGGGGYAPLGSGRSFDTLSGRLSADFRLQKDWRLGAGGEVVRANSIGLFEDRDTTELNTVFVESLYVFRMGRFLLAPQIRYLHSLAEVDIFADEIVAGEGTNQIEVGTWGAVKFGPVEPYFYVAYRSQNDGRAHMMPFQLGTKYFYQQMYFLAEVFGHLAISNDRYTNQEFVRANVTNLRNAGSLRFYSVNQTVYEGRGELGFKVSPDFTVYAGAAHTIDGKSAAYGYTLSAGITYTIGASERTWDSFADDPDEGSTDFTEDEIAKEHRKKTKKKKSKETFEPIRDDYDESLFTPSN
jgi:hypothetical protein